MSINVTNKDGKEFLLYLDTGTAAHAVGADKPSGDGQWVDLGGGAGSYSLLWQPIDRGTLVQRAIGGAAELFDSPIAQIALTVATGGFGEALRTASQTIDAANFLAGERPLEPETPQGIALPTIFDVLGNRLTPPGMPPTDEEDLPEPTDITPPFVAEPPNQNDSGGGGEADSDASGGDATDGDSSSSTNQTDPNLDSDNDGVPDSQDAAPDNASVQYDWQVEEYEDPWNADSEWDDDLYDNVIMRQIYEAASLETDPVLKEELIKEYERMGGNHLEDLLQERPAEDIYGDYPVKPPPPQAPDTEYDREAFDQAFPDGAFGQGFDDLDTDNDGIVDSSELAAAETNFGDDDSSGTSLVEELTDTNNPFDVLTDSDGDGVIDTEDAFPNDPSEQVDTDGDGIGDNADPNPNDAMPLDVDLSLIHI